MGAAFQRMLSAFYTRQLEVVLVGLENSGKTTLMNVLASGHPVDTVPTIGLNVKMIKRGGVQMKCWDIGGQAQYRGEWGRYTRGCDVIVYVVDAHAEEKVKIRQGEKYVSGFQEPAALARRELHRLLEDEELASTPLLVLANKVDLEPHMSEDQVIRELNLDYVTANPWILIPISALKVINIDQVLQWLVKQSRG